MNYEKTIFISGGCICKKDTVHINQTLNTDNRKIIRGRVLDENGIPQKNMTIEIREVVCDLIKIVGYTISDEKGRYLVAININKRAFYEFIVYKSIN